RTLHPERQSPCAFFISCTPCAHCRIAGAIRLRLTYAAEMLLESPATGAVHKKKPNYKKRLGVVQDCHTPPLSTQPVLENEIYRRCKTRQSRHRRVENRPSAHMAVAAAIEHGAADWTFLDHADQPSALLELGKQLLRRGIKAALQQNHVIGRAARPAGGQPAPLDADVTYAEFVQ